MEPEALISDLLIFFISRDLKGVWRRRSMKFLTSTEFKTGLKITVYPGIVLKHNLLIDGVVGKI